MKATTIVIGDEILIGQVQDTNSGFIARELNKIGIQIAQTIAIHDDKEQIISSIDNAFQTSDLVMLTGGLGPTKDDITKNTLCEYFHTELIKSESVKQHIEQLYSHRPQVINSLTATQWQVPKAAQIIENRVGSAPIMWFEQGNKVLISMPGVPFETEIAITEQIVPRLKKHFLTDHIFHKTLLVAGIPESNLAILLNDYEEQLPHNMHLAYLPKNRTIRLRLTAQYDYKEAETECEAIVNHYFSQLQQLCKDYLIVAEDKPLEILLGEQLKSTNRTICSAESCTGGKIAHLLNKHAGSSAFYMGSIIAYDNSVKQNILGVNPADLEKYGAVSEQVVRQMAEGARRLLSTDYAIATSGIAGPDGGTADKPVGTVWIAVATADTTIAQCYHFMRGNREQITDDATTTALNMALTAISRWSLVVGR